MNEQRTLTKVQLREKRLQKLLDSCQEQVLQQVIGPFGLTPAMFEDKLGGNVTTQHNANQGIFAQESEEYNRDDYDYQKAKTNKKRNAIKNGEMSSDTFTDEYTGKQEQTKRTQASGNLGMNAELDHTIPLKQIHTEGGWMLTPEQRGAAASEPENLHYTTLENNRSKSDKPAEEALSEENGYDPEIVDPIIEAARAAIDDHLPSTGDRVKYHSKRLVKTGVTEAGKNAVREALGVLLFEFVNSSFNELKQLFTTPSDDSLIERVINAFKRVTKRVIARLKDALSAAINGGVQAFISNFLTFIINTVITTSAKVVTIIREGMKGIWKAIKLLVSPPKDQPFSEVCRQVTTIITGVITMGLGMLFEESIKGFIAAIPILTPVAEVVATGITAVLTGIATALSIYVIDKFFDWLSSTGTELLQAYEGHMESMAVNINLMGQWLESQYQCSNQYRLISANYAQIEGNLSIALQQCTQSVETGETMIQSRKETISYLEKKVDEIQRQEADIDILMKRLEDF